MTNATDNSIIANLIINGRGFMNRIRTVNLSNGQPYIAVTMALEEGRVSNPKDLNKTYFECRVVGEDAKALLTEHFTDMNGEVSADNDVVVRAGVDLAGCEVNTFPYTKGDKAGKTGVSLRSRLLKIHYLSIDGNLVFTTKSEDTDNSPDSSDGAQRSTSKSVCHSDTTEANTSGQASTNAGDANPSSATATQLSASDRQALLDQTLVSLDKNDPLFNQKRLFLKANDYGWDKMNVAWVKKKQGTVDTAPLHEAKAALAAG